MINQFQSSTTSITLRSRLHPHPWADLATRGAAVAPELGLRLVLIVEELAPGTIGAATNRRPIPLTSLGLVFTVLLQPAHLIRPMGKLAVIPIRTIAPVHDVPADVRFEPCLV